MPLFTEAEKRKLLLGSIASGAETRTYTALLGFRQLSQTQRKNGSQMFTGLVGDFDKDTKHLVRKLATEYKSYKELEETLTVSPSFTHKDVEDCLEEYAWSIWNNMRPFVTITDNGEDGHESYMRHLNYSNKEDRARIRTYVYCWVLQRLSRNLRGKPKRSRGKQPNRMSEDDSVPLPPADPYIVPIDVTEHASGPSMSTNGVQSTQLGTTRPHQIPVARMVSEAFPKEPAHRRASTRKRRRSERGESSVTSFHSLQSGLGSRHNGSLKRKDSSGGFSQPWPPISSSQEGDNVGDNITLETRWPLPTKRPNFHGLPLSTEELGNSPPAGTLDAQTRQSITAGCIQSPGVTDNNVDSARDFAREPSAADLPISPERAVRKPTLVVTLKVNHAQICNAARSDTAGSSSRSNIRVTDSHNAHDLVDHEEDLSGVAKPTLHKRKRSLVASSLDTGSMTLRKRGKQPVHDLEERGSTSPGPFHPSPQGSSHDDERLLNFPNVHAAGPGIRELDSTSNLPPAGEDASGMRILLESNFEESYGDRDSVMSFVDESHEPQKDCPSQLRLQAPDHPIPHAPTIELQVPAESDPINRTRFSSQLLGMLRVCDPGNHDLDAMRKILKLTKSIWKESEKDLKEVYGHKFDQFNKTCIYWLEGMEELVAIRDTILQGFAGDRKARAVFLETLPEDLLDDAVSRLIEWKEKVSEWRGTHDSSIIRESSEDLASMFMGLIDWEGLPKSYLTRLVVAFNEKLWDWF